MVKGGGVSRARLRGAWPRGYGFAITGIAVGMAGLVALGATDLQLLGEVLRESLVVSLTGGVLGTALALGAGAAVDARAAHAGQQLFLFSGRLLAFALAFAVGLGAIAGAYATARILRVPPAEAIRRGA